jgi:hypothetical protein
MLDASGRQRDAERLVRTRRMMGLERELVRDRRRGLSIERREAAPLEPLVAQLLTATAGEDTDASSDADQPHQGGTDVARDQRGHLPAEYAGRSLA